MQAWLYVFLGGGLGSIARYGIQLLYLKKGWLNYPYATLSANIIGGYVIGLLSVFLLMKVPVNESQRLLWMVGFCGGFTTFSAFCLENLTMMQQGAYTKAVGYSLLSVTVCLASTAIGHWTGKLLS